MNNDLNIKLVANGFVIVDLLSKDEVVYLNKLCGQYLQITQTDFVSSSHILNQKDSDFINDELHKILQHKFESLFPTLQLLGGTLATKIKGKSNLEAHQDWTIVDENKFNSYNLWIPLVDTNSENGTLGLIPGSHKWNNNLRGFNIPNDYGKFTKQFLQIGFEPSINAGQAILYNHKLVHYSRPNITNENRNVSIVGVKEKAADLRISFCLDNKEIETYTMSEVEFYKFDAQKIKANKQFIEANKLNSNKLNWKNILNKYTENLPEEFQYLISKRESIFSKLLDKIRF